jgi:hypothetical protein
MLGVTDELAPLYGTICRTIDPEVRQRPFRMGPYAALKRRWERIAAHLTAAVRLRHRLKTPPRDAKDRARRAPVIQPASALTERERQILEYAQQRAPACPAASRRARFEAPRKPRALSSTRCPRRYPISS